MPPKASNAPDKVYHVSDIVLAKVKGYPSWPGQIIDNEQAPPNVKRDRPTKTKTTYLVRFFPTGDYAWTASRDLSSLTTREIEAYISSPAKKSGDLLTAYKIARDPTEWQRQRDEAQAEYDSLQAQAMQYGDVDELQSGDEDDGAAKKSKKRKSESGKSVAADRKTKKGKLEQLAKGRTASGASKGSAYADEEPERPVKKSKPIDDSEDPGLKQVKDWRHKLQKVFLGKTPPSAEDMPKCREYFEAMEDFDMNKEWLTESKLAKVLKRICLLKEGEIPDGDRYKFKERSSALALKWSQANGTGTPAAASPVPAAAEPTSEGAAAPAPSAPTPVEEKPVKSNGAAPTEVEEKTNANGSTDEAVKAEPAPEQAAAAPIEA